MEIGEPPNASAYTDLFVLQLYPYASVYLGAEGMLGGEARDRIAGFWRAIGETPPPEPDHLAVMLAQYATLAEGRARERDDVRRLAIQHAQETFLFEHLLSWLPIFLAKMTAIATPTYQAWAKLLLDVLAREAKKAAPPSELPLHLREAPALPDPGDVDRATFLSAVLAPIQAGMIFTRGDLSRAAHDTGLALRAGERRFQLNAMLDQDATATWSWLETEAKAWVLTHDTLVSIPTKVGEFWMTRAQNAERLFGKLARHYVDAAAPD